MLPRSKNKTEQIRKSPKYDSSPSFIKFLQEDANQKWERIKHQILVQLGFKKGGNLESCINMNSTSKSKEQKSEKGANFLWRKMATNSGTFDKYWTVLNQINNNDKSESTTTPHQKSTTDQESTSMGDLATTIKTD